MAFAWTPPAVLHALTPPPGLNTPVVNEVRTAVVMLAGSNPGLLAQSRGERRFGFVLTDSEPGDVAEVVPLGGATMPRTMTSARLMACTS